LNLSAAVFQKSNRSGPNGCVEVAFVDGHVAVRDSKHKDGPVLVFTSREWEAFLGGVADGQFHLPVPTPLD
jgi:prepilin-type processing-associated H-X9-DG protein